MIKRYRVPFQVELASRTHLRPRVSLYTTAVTITDPLVKYQAAVTAGLYAPDPAQHRLARHLHKVYLRIRDYTPQAEYGERLRQVARLADPKPKVQEEDGEGILALRGHSIWRNPLFKHLLTSPEGRESLALTRVLTNHETAIEINSPKGLFLSGEVGTGKSMLLDLLAEGLPTERKRRWHFNTFMLYTLSQLENHRKLLRPGQDESPGSEYSILWMAKKLVEESPILFLDEFQLPDRAASKILSHLFIAFFQLGGVLIASSNRVPEELQKAAGADYAPAPAQGLLRKLFGASRTRNQGELYGSTSDFANFLEVLKARCDFWQMEGAQDWRRRETTEDRLMSSTSEGESLGDGALVSGTGAIGDEPRDDSGGKKPRKYYLCSEGGDTWSKAVNDVVSFPRSTPIPWSPTSAIVYRRQVNTPRHYDGFVFWKFDDLVESFGPADYITMASTYHTFIIEDVPILTILKKNEARRFITLLDALYEARCKLVIQAQSPPDDLFFPEQRPNAHGSKPTSKSQKDATSANGNDDDATYSETIAEVYQDQMSPFRPNVSYYDTKSSTSSYDPDQDSDFGLQTKAAPVDFTNSGAFTGEDERFAYRRAASRLWELCSASWHSRTGDWWQPLPLDARHWEGGLVSEPLKGIAQSPARSQGEGMGQSVEIDEMAGLSKWRVADLKNRPGE